MYFLSSYGQHDRPYNEYPLSTEQILHPEKFMSGEKPVEIPNSFFATVPAVSYTFKVGELYLRYLLCKAGDAGFVFTAKGWGGGRLWLTPEKVLIMLLAWDSESDAEEFVSAWPITSQGQSRNVFQEGKYTLVTIGESQHAENEKKVFLSAKKELEEK